MNEVLDPIIRRLGAGGGAAALDQQVLLLVVKTAAEILGPRPGTRSCFLELQQGPPMRLVPTDYRAGRIGSYQRSFIAGTVNGDDAIQMVLNNGPRRFCPNIDETPPPGLDPAQFSEDYKTFISVPVVAGDTAYGMLTVDAPNPGDLEERDADLLGVMAGLAAIALTMSQ